MTASRRVLPALAALVPLAAATGASAKEEKRSPKKVIAVSNFEVTAQKYDESGGWYNREKLGDGMRSMLVEALQKTGKFIVVERGEGLKDIKEEQALKKAGDSRGAGAEGGALMAAQALFRGEITDFTPEQQGGKFSTGNLGPLSGLSVGTKNASVGVLVRWFDTTSGEVIDSWQASEKQSSVGFAVQGYHKIPFGTEAYTKTPIGKATNAVISKVVDKIVAAMAKVPFQCKVIKATGSEVFLNVGSDSGVGVGDKYELYGMGEALIDPDTGANLGADKTRIGVITVTKVQPKFSIATFEGSPSGTAKAGDVAQALGGT